MNYQGLLTDGAGNPVPDDNYQIKFTIYDAETGGNIKWGPETHNTVPVTDGLFSVILGQGTPPVPITAAVFDGPDRWLGITVGFDPEIAPRTRLTSVPYAFSDGTDNDWTGAGTGSMYATYLTDKVGIGRSNPAHQLDVLGDLCVCGPISASGLYLESSSAGSAEIRAGMAMGVGQSLHLYGGPSAVSPGGNLYLNGGGGTPGGNIILAFDVPGNVGIGTMDPQRELHVVGDAKVTDALFVGEFLQVGQPDAVIIEGGDPDQIRTTSGTLVFGKDGNFQDIKVGIGTENPDPRYRLHVQGEDRGIYAVATAGGVSSTNRPYGVVADLITDNSVTTGGGFLTRLVTSNAPNIPYVFGAKLTVDDDADHQARGLIACIYNGESDDYAIEIHAHAPAYAIYSYYDGIVYFKGDVGIDTNSPTEKLDVNGTARLRNMPSGAGTAVVADGNGVLMLAFSSKRYKKNITGLEIDPELALKLQPVRFEWKSTGEKDIGLIAEDVDQVIPDLVIYDSDGRPNAVKYDKVAIYLLETVKQQHTLIEELKTELSELRQSKTAEIESLKAQMAQMQALVETILARQSGGTDELAITK